MREELLDIIEKSKQLRAMEASLYDFADKLKKQQDEFLIKHLNFTKDQGSISPFDMLLRITEEKKEH